MGSKRPEVAVIPTSFDLTCLAATGFILLYAIIYVIWGYQGLPDRIPTHYDGAGVADGYGAKYSLLFILCLELGTSFSLFIASRYPHKHNYPIKITRENAAKVYGLSVSMLHGINLLISAFFTYMIVMTMRIANGLSDTLGTFSLWIFIVALTALIAYFLVRFHKAK
jgi:uncharacterized membrane protein